MIEPDRPPPIGRWLVLLILLGAGWFVADRFTGDRLHDILGDIETLVDGGEARRAPDASPAAAAPGNRPAASASDGGLDAVRLEDGITPPRKVSGPDPQYTEAAREGRVQGIVVVEAVIDDAGDVASARVLKPLPMGLDQAALDSVRQWKFEPARRDGVPIAVYYNLTVTFRLE